MDAALWQFAEMEDVYSRLHPLSPYGRRAVSRRQLLTDRAELSRCYDRIEALLAVLSDRAADGDRLRYHLRRIPPLPSLENATSASDLFLVKKFLVNVAALPPLLGGRECELFGLAWRSDSLLRELDTDARHQETFVLPDDASPALASVRREIRELDASLRALRMKSVATLRSRHGLDFADREFLVIDAERAANFPAEEVFVEPFDSRHVIARPVLPRRCMELSAARQALLDRERYEESVLLRGLADVVYGDAIAIQSYCRAVESIDVALAGADMARSLHLTRPTLVDTPGPIEITAGRLVPLEERCARTSLPYHPLSVRLDRAHALLHGSNMSGKSVVLKTVASLQLLAQLGLFVPAQAFSTPVFDRITYIGPAGPEEAARGLSSFGAEIVSLAEALGATDAPGRSGLLLIDEFARTTNSREALALLAGLLSRLDSSPRLHSLLATHYTGLPAFPRVRAFRMRGVDWRLLADLLRSEPPSDLAARVALVNRCVPYEMISEGDGRAPDDAIAIAEMLGLGGDIIRVARRQLQMEQPW